MPRSLSFALFLTLFTAYSVGAQFQDSNPPATPAQSPSPDSTSATEAKKPKKVWTNENLGGAGGTVSVVGDPKSKPKPVSSGKTANAGYIAQVRKQLEKYQDQIVDIDKQLLDLKNFSEGEPSTKATSGIKLNKSYNREPIEVQIRTLQDQKKDIEAKIDALLDEARKKGVESGDLR
jgi:hypothetical protein